MTSPDPSVLQTFCAAGLWAGVGEAIAETLADAGIATAADITEEALVGVPGIGAKKAKRLFTTWKKAAPAFDVATLLDPQELPIRWSRRLVELLGDDAAAQLTADPWLLLGIHEAEVADADRVARSWEPTALPTDPRRGRALVARILTRQSRSGHTVTAVSAVSADLAPFGLASAESVAAAVQAARDGHLIRVTDEADGGQSLALWQLAEAEEGIARDLLRLRSAARPLGGREALAAASEGLDDVQAAALTALAENGVSLLVGGPGTGKSRTIVAIAAFCRALGLELALAAPTGRAAKRLSELLAAHDGQATGDDSDGAMTIHRLLGAHPVDSSRRSTFERDDSNPLTADVVVIDEASMVDAELGAALTRAVPDGAHLLWVGDPAQLPSIGAGRVLGDLLDAAVFPTTELTTIYRHAEGGAIARLASAVRRGELPAPESADHEVVLVPAASSSEAARRVAQLVTDSIPRVFGVAPEEIQVITPVHRGPAGTEALNQILKKALNPGPHPGSRAVRGFDPGDRVVATANYLDAQPFGYANGEIGTVVDTESKSILVSFPGGDAEVSGKALGDLAHGWAVTVHRAQGSEWEAVVVVLPGEATGMLSRPLIYTALTRARRHLSVVTAAGPMVARAVRSIGAKPRRTRLAKLLSSAAAGGPAPSSRSAARRRVPVHPPRERER